MRMKSTLVAAAIMMVVPMAVSAPAGLLVHYSFDADFTDASGNNNDLTIATGTPTITNTPGEYVFGGGALDADSTTSTQEYLDLTSPITFGVSDTWSIAFWARRRPGTDNRTGMVIGDPSNNTDFIWLSNNPSQVQGLRFRSSSNTNANFGGFPDDNAFHHWVVIADGAGNVTSYRDNVLQGAVAIASDFSITSVAQAYNNSVQSMDGQIDELYIFDEAIDAAMVSSLYTKNVVSPTMAHDPHPENGGKGVEVPSITLSWTAGLDPNDPNFANPDIVEHYLWISVPYDVANPSIPTEWWEEAGTQQFTIPADSNPADGNVDLTVSKDISGLQKDKLYLWVVDEGLVGSSGHLETDPAKIIWGRVWRFETITSGPVADANSFITWLKDGVATVDLNGIVTDSTNDVAVIEWSVLTTPLGATVDIADTAAAATKATFTQTGTYVLRLYARDDTMQEDEAVIEVKVYNDSCEAAKNSPEGFTAPEFDFNDDCKEDFLDFALFAAKWLEDATMAADFLYDAGQITVPVVQFTNPMNGSVVSGGVIINVISYDPGVGISDGDGMQGAGGIDFDIIDSSGTILRSRHENTVTFDWDTWDTAEIDAATSLPVFPNGVYTIRVTATSDAGYVVIKEISVTVNN